MHQEYFPNSTPKFQSPQNTPDLGLALTALEGSPRSPFLKPQPYPPHPPSESPSLFPPPTPTWLFLQCSWKGQPWAPGWRGGGALGRTVAGGPFKRHLGPDPHLGVLDKSTEPECLSGHLSWGKRTGRNSNDICMATGMTVWRLQGPTLYWQAIVARNVAVL